MRLREHGRARPLGLSDAWRYDDEDYIVQMSEAGMSPERIVSLVNYDELIEASSESWMALLEAIDNSATAPEGTDDQVIRDMYAMLAANSADGAYATWLGNIYRAQRGHDPEAFETALSAFDSETRANIQYLADTEV